MSNDIDNTNYDADLEDIKQQFKNFLAQDPDLIRQLRSVGLGEAMIVRICVHFPIQNVYKLIFVENPYNLMEIEGIGFLKADGVARQLGMQSDDPRRQKALILSVLETNKNFGHVFLPITILEKECKKQNIKSFQVMLDELAEKGTLIVEGNRIYSSLLHMCEVEVSNMLKERIK